MYQQTSLFFYKILAAGVLVMAFLVLTSALVAALGANTVLDTRMHPYTSVADVNNVDSPNLVTVGVSAFSGGVQRVMLSMGSALYSSCRAITITTARSGRAVGHDSAVIAKGTWHGVASAIRGVGSGIVFTVRLPGKMVGSVTRAHPVSALIKPADDEQVPVISSETSTAALAHLNAEQQQQIAQLQAAQLTANRGLDGSVVAGDPNHGGYPAKWDNARQDSATDSWGMYSRECVSYAAWKVYQTYGDMPYWGGRGNANQWVRDARNAGIPTSTTPQVHSVAISMSGYYGHAMWVEKVNGDMIYVSQYNYDLHGHYSEMWVNGKAFTYIYFK